MAEEMNDKGHNTGDDFTLADHTKARNERYLK